MCVLLSFSARVFMVYGSQFAFHDGRFVVCCVRFTFTVWEGNHIAYIRILWNVCEHRLL